MEEEAANGFFLLYVSSGMGSCIWMILVFYNLISLVGFMRSDTGGESASVLSKLAWAVGFFSFMLGPCAWLGAVAALIMAKVERGRIYEEASTVASSTPCSMASINGGVTLVLCALFMAGGLSAALL
jgi:hypothetical protein